MIDSSCNELNYARNIIKEHHINVNEIGPFNSTSDKMIPHVDGYKAEYNYFRNIAQYNENSDLDKLRNPVYTYYYIDFDLNKTSVFEIYLRNRREIDSSAVLANTYP